MNYHFLNASQITVPGSDNLTNQTEIEQLKMIRKAQSFTLSWSISGRSSFISRA